MLIGSICILVHVLLVNQGGKYFFKMPPVMLHAFSAILLTFLLVILSFIACLDVWLAFCFFSFGVSSYLFLFGAIYKSLSLRFLIITKSQGGRASFEELDNVVTKMSFSERAKLLCQMGMVIKEQEQYCISFIGKRFAHKINRLRRIFRITSLGLY